MLVEATEMNNMRLSILIFLALGLAACASPAKEPTDHSNPEVTITSPTHDATFYVGEDIDLVAEVRDHRGRTNLPVTWQSNRDGALVGPVLAVVVLVAPGAVLVALLAPEHGIRGTAAEGVTISDEVDTKTGIPIYSLYMAEDRGPTPEMLKDVDVLVYDLQEVGGRTWDLLERSMPVDVYESDRQVIVRASVPGTQPENLDIQYTDGLLTIRAVAEEQEERDTGTWHIRERRSGINERTVPIPRSADIDRAEAELENGVLTITFPIAEHSTRRRIQIRSGSDAESAGP
jgi:HSP20 family protein